MAVKTRIQHRRDTQANWDATSGVVLLAGEIGYVTSGDNAGNFKIGNGASTWAQLPYLGNEDTTISAGTGITVTDGEIAADFGTASGEVLEGTHAGATTGVHGVGSGAVVGTTLTQTLANKTFQTNKDKINVVAAAPASTQNIDVKTANVWYFTTAANATFVLNFRGDGSTTLNNTLGDGEAITVVALVTQGTGTGFVTDYYPTAVTIDGTSATVNWQLGESPAAGDASAINSYTFTIIKTASAAYTVLGAHSRFSS
jgi:hypothetical protein